LSRWNRRAASSTVPKAVEAPDITGLIDRLATAHRHVYLHQSCDGVEWRWYFDLFHDCTKTVSSLIAEVKRLQPFEEELQKIADDVGEPNDPFAAWESIEALRAQAALASVPAPSGTEPVADQELQEVADGAWGDGPMRRRAAFMEIERRATVEHAKAAAPQAVPAENVAGLVERLNAAGDPRDQKSGPSRKLYREAAAALTNLSARLASAETARYVAATNYIDLIKYKERLEAEATSLRRKLEEAERSHEAARQNFHTMQNAADAIRRKLEERERIGKMMANAAYNIHQRAADIHVGFGLDEAIRSLKSVQEEWDRAMLPAAPLPEDTHHGS
jgi:hypothetical protein